MVVVIVREACCFIRSMCYHSCLLFLRGSFFSCRIKSFLLVLMLLEFSLSGNERMKSPVVCTDMRIHCRFYACI